MNCKHCKQEIPEERLEAVPNTDECVKCSTTQKYFGVMVFPHKTGGEAVLIKPEKKEMLRQAKRFNSRAR